MPVPVLASTSGWTVSIRRRTPSGGFPRCRARRCLGLGGGRRHRAFPLPFVGPAAGRVFGVAVPVTFFARVMEGLVGLGDRVGKGRGVPGWQGGGLHFVAVTQQRAVVAPQLAGELQGRYTLREAAQYQHDLGAGIVGPHGFLIKN